MSNEESTVDAVNVPTDNTTTNADATQQDNTEKATEVKEVDTNESNLLDKDSKPAESSETDKPASEDLLGDIEQQEGQEQAPDKYEPFTLADGKEMDAEDAEAISAIAKEHGLTQESAQKAALVANDLMDKMVEQHEESKAKLLAENAEAWKKSDPNGEQTMLARKAVEKLGPEMHQHLKDNGYLNDARIMSLLADYGQRISEGKSISGKPAPTQSLLYPNTPELHNS